MGSNLSRSPSEEEFEFDDTYDTSSAGVDELWNLKMCITYIERKLDDLDLDTYLNKVISAQNKETKDISHDCKYTRKELRGRLCLLKGRHSKIMKEISQPKKKLEKHVSICRKQSERRRKESLTYVTSYKRPCRRLASLDDTYRSITQCPITLPTIYAQ